MRWSWKLTAQHYRFYPHENITHLTIGPGIDDFSTFKKLAITWFKIDLNSYAVFFKNLIRPKFLFRDFKDFKDPSGVQFPVDRNVSITPIGVSNATRVSWMDHLSPGS